MCTQPNCVQLCKIAPYKFHKEAQIAAVCDIIGLVVAAHMLRISAQTKI